MPIGLIPTLWLLSYNDSTSVTMAPRSCGTRLRTLVQMEGTSSVSPRREYCTQAFKKVQLSCKEIVGKFSPSKGTPEA